MGILWNGACLLPRRFNMDTIMPQRLPSCALDFRASSVPANDCSSSFIPPPPGTKTAFAYFSAHISYSTGYWR